MHQCIKDNVQNWEDEGEIADFLTKILNKEAFDHTGLVYGMGHAVYTLSDPRAVILRENAKKMAENTEFEREYKLLEAVERLTPELFKKIKFPTDSFFPPNASEISQEKSCGCDR